MNKLVILGAGAYAKTIKDIAEQLGYIVVAMLDDRYEHKKLDSFVLYIQEGVFFIPAFGNNEFRLLWCEKIIEKGGSLATLIHPTAYISPYAKIGDGSVVLPHAIVNTDVKIGKGCIVNLNAAIDHDCIIEDGCHICISAIVKGENRIPKYMKVEAGSVVERATMN